MSVFLIIHSRVSSKIKNKRVRAGLTYIHLYTHTNIIVHALHCFKSSWVSVLAIYIYIYTYIFRGRVFGRRTIVHTNPPFAPSLERKSSNIQIHIRCIYMYVYIISTSCPDGTPHSTHSLCHIGIIHIYPEHGTTISQQCSVMIQAYWY